MDALLFASLVAACAPQVDPETARSIVAVESGFNAFAIGVVAGQLDRQPRSRGEAIATIRSLTAQRYDYSVGLAQINARNFNRLGLTPSSALDACTNLSAMQVVVAECFARASRSDIDSQTALRKSLSCYYSGNFMTGFAHGYVARVARASIRPPTAQPRPSLTLASKS